MLANSAVKSWISQSYFHILLVLLLAVLRRINEKWIGSSAYQGLHWPVAVLPLSSLQAVDDKVDDYLGDGDYYQPDKSVNDSIARAFGAFGAAATGYIPEPANDYHHHGQGAAEYRDDVYDGSDSIAKFFWGR
jgi:hypothetical protein